MKKILFATLFLLSLVITSDAQTTKTLSPLYTFGGQGDGSIRPGDFSWVDGADMNQRGIAHDPITGRLVYINTQAGSSGTNGNRIGTIEILDASSGAEITTLNTNGIDGGNYFTFAVGVADDGVVYVCNHVSVSGTVAFKIYRWDSVNSIDPPVVAFNSTIAPTQRYGASMDIRGSGANTQIIIGSMPGNVATNVVIFTTADGTNFTANVLSTDATSANFNDGIAFGPGNTFWAKRINAPLRYMSFNLATSNATTIASFTTTNMPGVQNLGPIAVDPVNNLLAAIELVGGTVTSAPERVWLFDISDTSKPPSALSSRDFVPNNQNSTAPLGFVDFGGGNLYASVTRNGILASSVDTIALPPPIITKDLLATNRVAIGQTARFEVQASPNITGYEWRLNGNPISGQTNYFLEVPNVQTNDTGKIFSVAVSNAAGTTVSASSYLYVVNPADLYHLNLLWSIAPGQVLGGTNWYTGTGGGVPTERTIAYNALSNQLYVVFRNGNTVRISVINPDTGERLYLLRTNGIVLGTPGGNVPLCAIAVADDGAIYACNSVLATDVANFRVYRWANSHPDTMPTIVFNGHPAIDVFNGNARWGDNLDVRGSGLNTEIILDAQNETKYIGLLQPTDAFCTNFTAKGYLLQNASNGPGGGAGGTGIGRSLQFGEGETIWQKRWAAGGAPLTQSGFEKANPGTVAPLLLSSSAAPLYTNGPVGINFSVDLGAAISLGNNGNGSSVPDKLDLYDLTSPLNPVLLNRYNFPVAASAANANRIGQVIFTTNYVFALDANNGIVAFTLAVGPVPPPSFLTQPRNLRLIEGSSGTLSVLVDQEAAISWQKDGVNVGTGANFVINNAQSSAIGNYWAIATNANGVATSQVVTVSIGLTNDNYRLTQSWATAPGTTQGTDYVTGIAVGGGSTTGPAERSFAYNALSNHLVIVQCPVVGLTGQPSAATPYIHVVDAASGVRLHGMHTEGFVATVSEVGGSNPINMLSAAVADDGAVYISNGTPNGSGGTNDDSAKKFRIYRWANSGPDAQLTEVFVGDPFGHGPGINVRWGDTMSVRGSGLNTELIVDSNDGLYAAVLRPSDANMTNFVSDGFLGSGPSGSIGRSLQFSQTSSIWQKRKGSNLVRSIYNTTNDSSVAVSNLTFSATLGGVAVDEARKFVAGVDFVGSASTRDAVALYDISVPEIPMLIARYNMPANQPGNANFISQTIIAGNRIYALDGNAGLAAFDIIPPPNALALTLNISYAGGNVNLSWSDPAAVLQSTTALTTTPVWTDISTVGQTNVVDSAAGPAKFYRLKK